MNPILLRKERTEKINLPHASPRFGVTGNGVMAAIEYVKNVPGKPRFTE